MTQFDSKTAIFNLGSYLNNSLNYILQNSETETDFFMTELKTENILTVKDKNEESECNKTEGNLAGKAQIYVIRPEKAITKIEDGMYRPQDKLAFMATVERSDNVPLTHSMLILQGLNHNEIMFSNNQGVVCDYINPDVYFTGYIISKNNMVYNVYSIKDKNKYIKEIKTTRANQGNMTYQQIHRRFD
jgi:hypothetical protein